MKRQTRTTGDRRTKERATEKKEREKQKREREKKTSSTTHTRTADSGGHSWWERRRARYAACRPLETPAAVSRARLAFVVEGTRRYHHVTRTNRHAYDDKSRAKNNTRERACHGQNSRRESESTPGRAFLFRVERRDRARHEPTPSMDATILRRRRVYCPHYRPSPSLLAASSDLSPLPRAPLFPSPLNHAGFFSYLAAPPTLSLPVEPLLPLHPGVSAVPTGILLQNLSPPILVVVLSSSLPCPLSAAVLVPLNPDPSTTSFAVRKRFPYVVFLSFAVRLALTRAIRVQSFLVHRAERIRGHKLGRYVHTRVPVLRELSFFRVFPGTRRVVAHRGQPLLKTRSLPLGIRARPPKGVVRPDRGSVDRVSRGESNSSDANCAKDSPSREASAYANVGYAERAGNVVPAAFPPGKWRGSYLSYCFILHGRVIIPLDLLLGG